MYIDIEFTPNPNARKFVLPSNVISTGSKQFDNYNQAKDDILASSLFDLSGVVSIFYHSNFITVTKNELSSWNNLEKEIKSIISANFQKVQDGVKVNKENTGNDIDKINEILNETVRPALAMDGGGLEVVSFENMKLSVKYHGACGSCPSSTYATLQAITFILQENFHPDLEVVAI